MRKKLIAANWKMFKTPDQTRDFFRDFLPLVQGHDRDEIVVCHLPRYRRRNHRRQGIEHRHRRARCLLADRRRIHRRNLRQHVGRGRRNARPHRTLRTPPVFRRDRRHRKSQTQVGARSRTHTPSSASAKFSKSAEPDSPTTCSRRQCPARLQNKVSAKKAAHTGRRLRTGVGHWNRKDCDSADGGRCSCPSSAAKPPIPLVTGIRRQLDS